MWNATDVGVFAKCLHLLTSTIDLFTHLPYLRYCAHQTVNERKKHVTITLLNDAFRYTLGTYFSWFIITVVDIIFSVVLLLCIRTVPESPVYLLHKGHKTKAGEELMRLRGATEFHQIEKELNEVRVLCSSCLVVT